MAVDKLKNQEDVLVNIMNTMVDECHKMPEAVNVELGEFLYGLCQNLEKIIEFIEAGGTFESSYLPNKSGFFPKYAVGGHPSNFMVYIYPMLEAMCLGYSACILNHPGVPTAADKLLLALRNNGVKFNHLIHATVSKESDMQQIFGNNIGLFIGGPNTGESLSRVAPFVKFELSGANQQILTKESYEHNREAFFNSLKLALGYNGGGNVQHHLKYVLLVLTLLK